MSGQGLRDRIAERLKKAKEEYPLFIIIILQAVLLGLTIDKYYGYYYDNKFFNLLSLELWENFKVYLYLGSHYHVPSTIYSYLAYPFFLIFGPGDLAIELLSSFLHTLTLIFAYMLGRRFHGKALGLIFALFVSFAPIHLIQIYTLPDLSFAILLNTASVYYFMTGLDEGSRGKIALSAVLFSLGCFQAIYSLLLLPFYLVYSFYPLISDRFKREDEWGRGFWGKLLTFFAFILMLPAFTYLYLLLKATFIHSGLGAPALFVFTFIALSAYIIRKKYAKGSMLAALLFPAIVFALLSYFDLIVQIDYLFFDHSFGYFLDASPAGGYGGRPLARFMGKEINIYGFPVYMSVLTSMFEFVGKDFARVSSSLDGLRFLYNDYFMQAFPGSVRAFFFLGIFFLVKNIALKAYGEKRLPALYAYPLVFLLVAVNPFINLGPDYYNIRRIYLLPFPYLIAAFGITGLADLLRRAVKNTKAIVCFIMITSALVTLDQLAFSMENIYHRYTEDKKYSMYFKLFYGHYYGRSYKEAGEFLLKDAPLKRDGVYRAALVYTIPEDSKTGRSLPLFNSINWYTRDELKVIYDFKSKSTALYGTREGLEKYIRGIFKSNPSIEAVYFADFMDNYNNYSFFSRAHREIKPYAIVDDDGNTIFDCILFKFERKDFSRLPKKANLRRRLQNSSLRRTR